MEPIPKSVERFLHANIDSVDQLEILRLIARDVNAEYSPHALSKELNIPADAVQVHIKTLHSKGLLTIPADQPLVCKWGGHTPELDGQVQSLVQTYLERPVTLIKMVYDHLKQMRLFADAFRLEKEK